MNPLAAAAARIRRGRGNDHMEHEATVVLEKDYLNKPRRPDREEPRARPRPGRDEPATANEDSPARDQPRKERSDAPGDGRGSAFRKPGWFDRA